MGRFLTHLALTSALVAAPAMRVLCDTTCLPEASPMAEQMVASDATPECHEHDEGHHPTPESDSAPLQDDCTHGGESSSSSLFASVKSFGGDGPRVPVTSTVAVTHVSTVSSDIGLDALPVPSTGQRLGLFLTPLRI